MDNFQIKIDDFQMLTHSVLLSTTVTNPTQTGSPIAYCSDNTNKANASFVINWAKVLDNSYMTKVKYCRVRASLSTIGNTNITYDNNLGTLRCNLTDFSTAQSNNGGLILGVTIPSDLGITITGTPHRITVDTTQTKGVVCNIPQGIQTLNVQFLDISEALQTNIPNYQLILYFDMYSERNLSLIDYA